MRLAIQTARAWGVPPRQVVLGQHTQWEEVDSRLSMALTLLEAETCTGCGTPAWLGHSTNNEIAFSVNTTTCYGCAELEKHQKQKSKLSQTPNHGAKSYPVPRMWDGSALPSRIAEHRRQSGRE